MTDEKDQLCKWCGEPKRVHTQRELYCPEGKYSTEIFEPQQEADRLRKNGEHCVRCDAELLQDEHIKCQKCRRKEWVGDEPLGGKDEKFKELPEGDFNRCPHCKMDRRIRNPSGFCDHLYYPECCPICQNIIKRKRGLITCPLCGEDGSEKTINQSMPKLRKAWIDEFARNTNLLKELEIPLEKKLREQILNDLLNELEYKAAEICGTHHRRDEWERKYGAEEVWRMIVDYKAHLKPNTKEGMG